MNHTETIKCLECGKEQEATVEQTIPFYSYVHFCTCGHIITESDRVKVENTPVLKD